MKNIYTEKVIVPIYGSILTFYRTDGSFEKLKKGLSKKYNLHYSESAGGSCFSQIIDGFHNIFITIDTKWYKKDKAALYGTVVHEVVHAVNFMCIQKGIQPDRYNDESQAYITEWMFMKAYKFFK